MDVKKKLQLNVNLRHIDIVIGKKLAKPSQEFTMKDLNSSQPSKLQSVSEALETVKKIRQQLTKKSTQQRNQMVGALSHRQSLSFLA